MVLQRAPAKAAVYGFGAGPVSVKVVGTVTGPGGVAVSYTVGADHFEGDTMPGNSLGQARSTLHITKMCF